MLSINPGLTIWTIISFALFLVILSKFAWKPIIQALGAREDQIRSALEQAEKARAEAAEMMKQNEKNMARAEEEFRKLVREGKAVADKMKDDILTKARQQAQQEVDRAHQEIQRDVERAKVQLRSEVADLAIRAAEKILDETLDATRQKKIVDNFLNQLPKN